MFKKKVLVIGNITQNSIEQLNNHPMLDVTLKIGISTKELINILENYEILITTYVYKIDSNLIKSAKRLEIIAQASVGIDNIDIESIKNYGIKIINVEGGGTISVSEYTILLMLALSRNLYETAKTMKKGLWNKNEYRGNNLDGKTLGIIGLGNIGSQVAKISNCFKMNVIAYDPYIDKSKFDEVEAQKYESLYQLVKTADFISIHIPLNDETRNMISGDLIDSFKQGVILINTSRGGIVDENALIENLCNGKIKGLGLDVFLNEPNFNTKLICHPKTIATPHIAGTTNESKERICNMLIEKLFLLL